MYNIYIKEKKEEEEKVKKKQQSLYIDSPKYKRERDIMANSYNKRINDYIIENVKNNDNIIKIQDYKSTFYHPKKDFIKINEKKNIGKKDFYQNKNNIEKINKSLEFNKQFNVSKTSFINKIKNDISIKSPKSHSNINKSNIINSEINFNKILSSIMNKKYIGSENNNCQFNKDIYNLKNNFYQKYLRNKSDNNLFDDYLNINLDNKKLYINQKFKISKNSIKNKSFLSPQHNINNNTFINRLSKIKIKKKFDNHHTNFKSVMRIANNIKDLSINNYNSISERKKKINNKEMILPIKHYIKFINPNKIKKKEKGELGNIDILKKIAFDKDYFDSQKEECDEIISDLDIKNLNNEYFDFGIPQEDLIIIENKQYNIKKDINLLAKKVLRKYNIIQKPNSKILKLEKINK